MTMIKGIDIDKEVREGWTIRDFMNEIDDLVFDVFMGNSIYHSPKNCDELSELIENLMPKHIFTNKKQLSRVVKDLTKIFAIKYGLAED